ELTDLGMLGALCRARDLLFGVDNSLATPLPQPPVSFGADLAAQPAPKRIDSHSPAPPRAPVPDSQPLVRTGTAPDPADTPSAACRRSKCSSSAGGGRSARSFPTKNFSDIAASYRCTMDSYGPSLSQRSATHR